MVPSVFLIINLKIHRSVFGTDYEWVTPYNYFFLVITCSWPLIVYFQIECEIGFGKIYRHPLIWKIVSVDFIYPVPSIYAGYRIYPFASVCLRLFISFFCIFSFYVQLFTFLFCLTFFKLQLYLSTLSKKKKQKNK